MTLMCQKVVSQLKGDCAASKWRELCCEWHSCAKNWFRSCETPFQMVSRLRNSRSTLRACLQTAITSSFHLQIAYRLKRWTPDFQSFPTRYCMHNLNFGKWSRCVQQLPKWGCGCEIGIFHFLGLRSHFAAAKWESLCCGMALVCQNRLRNCEIPCGMELWLRNWEFSRFGASQPFRSCEMRVTVLRNGTRVPKVGFAAEIKLKTRN